MFYTTINPLHAGEQKSHWDQPTNKGKYHLKILNAFYLSCPSATFALQQGGFVPRKWPAAKGLFNPINPF